MAQIANKNTSCENYLPHKMNGCNIVLTLIAKSDKCEAGIFDLGVHELKREISIHQKTLNTS